ncbi:MAG TPA: hypothetical protein VJV96_05735 [Candidatus Angelobacter sp.]|nr:hypothetical protein [Candidatus Angelobacter sp.]
MTIFGFNTDVKVGDVVYHVQSEARQRDMLLQTMVFVKGQCVGKRAVSYAQKSAEPDFSEQAMHEFLKSQHKAVLEAIQHGRVNTILGSDSSIQDVGNGGLTLNWMNASEIPDGPAVSMQFQVLDEGNSVAGANVSVSSAASNSAPAIASATTDVAGNATIRFSLTPEMLEDSSVMARAEHQGKSATRKFRFKK